MAACADGSRSCLPVRRIPHIPRLWPKRPSRPWRRQAAPAIAHMAVARGIATGAGSIPANPAAQRAASAAVTETGGAPRDAAMMDAIAPGASTTGIRIDGRGIGMSASDPRSRP